jgi:Zn-dependent peptidase ImmA (M78 family)/transcriptional regulator with XRE-family HTH domain
MTMNPCMLILAREAQGMTQEELARSSGAAQSSICKAEKGSRLLPDHELPAVATALRVTSNLLCWQDEVYGFGSASFFHRKQQSLPQRTLRKIQARVNILRMRLHRLLGDISVETPLSIPRIDIEETGSAAEIARRLRAAWRIPMGPVLNLVSLVEAAGGIVVRQGFESHRINAISVWHPGVGPLFTLNDILSPESQRFILAHELGHMIIHEGEPPREGAELEADQFAEELLMPAAEITTDLLDIDVRKAMTLKPYWRVPMQSLILRAQHLDLITYGRSRSLHAYMNKAGYLRLEPMPLAREKPVVLDDMVRIQLTEHGYSPAELAEFLGMPEEYLWEDLPTTLRSSLRIVR